MKPSCKRLFSFLIYVFLPKKYAVETGVARMDEGITYFFGRNTQAQLRFMLDFPVSLTLSPLQAPTPLPVDN